MANNQTIYIQDNEINKLEEDTFGHRHIADAVVQSILATKSPFTIGIFGSWGTGKSSLLGLIDSLLKNKGVATVTIDAWRYSSADNLRRAFLIHVANELAHDLLDGLRIKLYTSGQETLPKSNSKLDISQVGGWQRIKENLIAFLGISIVFIVVLFLVLAIRTVITNKGFVDFWNLFDWINFLDRFLDLAFVPFILALLTNLRIFVIPRPVTVTQERIDADELFAEYFELVVNKALKWKKTKKLVVFVDNLDRLTEDKMVEALESLKTYLDNDKCVFVVACDDRVVREVVNKSHQIVQTNDQNINGMRAGEHYLDKFFQQTFRLPEYMAVNLSDFALKNFETTKLCVDLKALKVDVHYLISIIIPSDVNSPRKVKRLLNEFIALYEIVRRRERKEDGQLRSGILTDNIGFLGKFSTIRAEYPEFYKDVIKDTSLISEITDILQDVQTEENQTKIDDWIKEYSGSLIAYLRKTQMILVDDIEPYIWLSQDTLALGLTGSHYTLLRTALANGDIETVKTLIDDSVDSKYKSLFAIVALRTVDQRLIGIEQRNGVRVLCHLFPYLDISLKSQIAHVAAKLITLWPANTFSADEVLSVLRWATMVGITKQKEKLVNQILDRLKNVPERITTFRAILQNADVIEQNKGTTKVKKWLSTILTNKQENLSPSDETITSEQADEVKLKTISDNREFAEWLIGQASEYSENPSVIQSYFAHDLVVFMSRRLNEEDESSGYVFLEDSEGLGYDIRIAFELIAREIGNGYESESFWKAILIIIGESNTSSEIEFAIKTVELLFENFPSSFFEEFLETSVAAIRRMVDESEANSGAEDLIAIIETFGRSALKIRSRRETPIKIDQLREFVSNLSFLLGIEGISEKVLSFIENYLHSFGKDENVLFMQSVIGAFSNYADACQLGELNLNFLINWRKYMKPEQWKEVVLRIDQLFKSNEAAKLEIFNHYLALILGSAQLKKIIVDQSVTWLDLFSREDTQLLKEKLNAYDSLVTAEVINANDLINKIISQMPFGGDQAQLDLIMTEIEKVGSKISGDVGINLFDSVMNNIDFFVGLKPRALRLLSRWIKNVNEASHSSFHSSLYSTFSSAPSEIMDILSDIWQSLTEKEIQMSVIQIFSANLPSEIESKRNGCIYKGLEAVPQERRAGCIYSIWNELNNQGFTGDGFLSVAVELISLDELNVLRNDAINRIRISGASPLSEIDLTLLASTIRRDVREIMPLVDLFVNLFGRGDTDIIMALKFVVPCLKPFDIRNDHKHKLAEAMGHAALRTESKEINDEIHKKADQIGLMWFSYKKYWH